MSFVYAHLPLGLASLFQSSCGGRSAKVMTFRTKKFSISKARASDYQGPPRCRWDRLCKYLKRPAGHLDRANHILHACRTVNISRTSVGAFCSYGEVNSTSARGPTIPERLHAHHVRHGLAAYAMWLPSASLIRYGQVGYVCTYSFKCDRILRSAPNWEQPQVHWFLSSKLRVRRSIVS
jgi:hypothetical protein